MCLHASVAVFAFNACANGKESLCNQSDPKIVGMFAFFGMLFCQPIGENIFVIWNIMGTVSGILFAIVGTKLVRSLMIVVRNFTNLVRNTIPK